MPLLPETVSRVDDLVARAHAGGRVPVLVAGVVRDGDLQHVATGGLDGSVAGLQFRLGSITKTMTAALVLALRDEGRLALDDLLYRHLPGTPVGAVTLRQLLGHAGGVQREPDGAWWERAAGVDVDTFLSTLTADKVAYPPLHGYHYSNLAYGLLGAMVARLGGEDWPSMLAKRLLRPLQLDRTTYGPVEPFARGYVVHPWLDELREEPRHDAAAMAPAGQLWSTVDDLARWAAFLAEPDPASSPPRPSTRCAHRSSSATSTAGPPGTAWACSCGGAASGSSSGTAARCPATWRSSPCTGPAGRVSWRSATRTPCAMAARAAD